MREIGRLRELTFRTVGEGTGKARDLDRFDDSYLHLFVWDDSSRRVIGAYRLGLTDRILESTDKDGLYTHTLFNYRDELLEQIGPAIELGRSFVRREHQKEMVLGSMALSIPLLFGAAIFTGLAGVIVVCAALAVIAIATAR